MENDIKAADCWSSMVDIRGMSDEKLRAKLEDYSLEADLFLLRQWSQSTDARMAECCHILEDVIAKKS